MDEKVAIVLLFVTAGVVVVTAQRAWLAYLRHTKLAASQQEMLNRIVDKLGSGPELAAWLESGDLKRFIDTSEKPASPYARILNTVQAGLWTLSAGFGLIVVSDWNGAPYDIGRLLAFVGGGLLLSGAVSWLLSRAWGLLPSAAPADRQ